MISHWYVRHLRASAVFWIVWLVSAKSSPALNPFICFSHPVPIFLYRQLVGYHLSLERAQDCTVSSFVCAVLTSKFPSYLQAAPKPSYIRKKFLYLFNFSVSSFRFGCVHHIFIAHLFLSLYLSVYPYLALFLSFSLSLYILLFFVTKILGIRQLLFKKKEKEKYFISVYTNKICRPLIISIQIQVRIPKP